MTPVGLRLNLTPEVLSKLVAAVADKFRRFVRISRTEHAGSFYQVDLRILDAYDVKEPKAAEGTHPTESVTVTREMVGELFDLLGIFPSQINMFEVDGAIWRLEEAAKRISGIGALPSSADMRTILYEVSVIKKLLKRQS